MLKPADYGTADVPGKTAPLSDTLGVHDDIVAFKAGGTSHQAAIKQFLDFVYQDKWQLQFDNEYDLLPATQSAATTMGKNTMLIVTVTIVNGRVTSLAPSRAASKADLPMARWRDVFSRTTMDSSISRPITSARPPRVMAFKV